MPRWYVSARARLALALAGASLGSLGLYLIGAWRNHSFAFPFLVWNLLLAWVPLLLMLWLERILRRKLWSSWAALLATTLLVLFLPNAFYVITDTIHLQEITRLDPVFDVAMFGAFALTAFSLGLVVLSMLHQELRLRLKPRTAWVLMTGLLVLVSFAVYMGRDLRWSTWDVVLNPTSILFEISEHVVNPTAHPEAFTATLGFFVLIGSTYVITAMAGKTLRQQKS